MINVRKLETELWESADLLRSGSKLTSQEYCMPVLGLIFLRYAYSRFQFVEKEVLKSRPVRGGRVLPVEASDFKQKSALFLPEKARYPYLLSLPDDADIGKAVNEAMELIEGQSEQLRGVLPKTYSDFKGDLLRELLRIFNNSALDSIEDDVIGRIYEYFLNKFAPVVASDDGVFFTPKSLVRMIVNVIEPTHGVVLDPACGSGGMFVASSDFVAAAGEDVNAAITFYGQEKVLYNAKLCLMNMAVHGLNANILSGDEANTFYSDAHNLAGCCDFVMANPPFNVDKVKSESTLNAGRLPFGLPNVNKSKEISNANYLWISYFYAYLNETGRAGFVMASSATDSSGKDKEIRKQLIQSGAVDVIISVGNNFFYTKSLPCSLWFFDRSKKEEIKDKVLFIDSRNYYTVVDRTLNEWNEWQLKNLSAIVWLYRGETDKYCELLAEYEEAVKENVLKLREEGRELEYMLIDGAAEHFRGNMPVADPDFTMSRMKAQLEKYIKIVKTSVQLTAEEIKARGKKALVAAETAFTEKIKEILTTIQEYEWLTEKFGEGNYADIPGLCKVATLEEIEAKGYSLTPGAYVGVAPTEDDGVDFHQRMMEIHKELRSLQEESNRLMETISKNWEEMGL